MSRSIVSFVFSRRAARFAAVALALLGAVRYGSAQDTPLLSGGVGFFTSTDGGNTTYLPIIEPLLAAPIGNHLLIESRATLLEAFSPNGGGKPGYDHTHVINLNYLQGDYFVTPHLTLVGGSFLIPFGTYNERLSELWIENFQDGPLISGLGTFTSSGVGGQLRGSAVSRPRYSIDYAAYFSTRSAHEQFLANRSSGGRVSLYLPQSRLEVGLSYGRLLEGQQENFYGAHVWWEPEHTAFRLRSEYARAHHVQGYWIEADYRTQAFGGLDSWIGRFEPVFRIQQTFRRDAIVSDGLPLVNVQRADFGLDYNLPHNTRILTSYGRQFSSSGNKNVWETGIVYRFLFPTWKAR